MQLSNLTVALRRRFPSLLLAAFVIVTSAVLASACGGREESGPEPPDASVPSPPGVEVSEEATASAGLVPLEIEPAFPGLTFREMVDLTLPQGDDGRLFVVLREGVIRAFENSGSVTDSHVFLDIRDLALTRGSEEGLLGLAFAPDYAESGHFYVYYTAPNPRRSVVARYKADLSTGTVPDSTPGETILEVLQPFSNHNGGQIAFGPNGFLYVALGDGGGAGDRLGHGQNPHTLLGTISEARCLHSSQRRCLRHSVRQPVRGRRGGPSGNLRVRPAQSLALRLRRRDRSSLDGRRWPEPL